ncbi:interactor of HORMAD1 protein 1 [Neopsephotus bourkii]|uniref:interactor of HORMAD1 protein 1 n=1 Tax=Neopsephotus bourkii TaxID=309878 RepID=UPI002AA59223|nr:interactor of HORMAD1 protein 1 [Neopsephotus bourkii]
MNPNVWNIKEMLSTPAATGSNKFSVRSSTPSDYSSLSDSQLLFGSQFCPENVQSAAALLELGTQPGKRNSQDTEPSIFTKYQKKPQLFDEEIKEKASLHFGAGRVKNILESFEANKNKIKDKYDREVLSTFISSIKDRLQGLQGCLDQFGEMLDSRNKSILAHLETISKTLQDAFQSQCGLVLKALTDKSQTEQALLEMERRLEAKDAELLDVKSSVQLLKEGLESLPAQLRDQHLKLYEELGFLKLPNTLAELHTFISIAKARPAMADNSSQTSPGPCQLCALREESPLGPFHLPCTSQGEQHGDSPMRNEVTGDGTSRDDLNTASGGNVSPSAAEVCREHSSLQEVKHSSESQSSVNHPYVCCAHSHFLGGHQKQHCPAPQEVPRPTPLRKAIRRSAQGFQSVMPSRQKQPQVSHLPVWKDVPGRRDSNWNMDCEVENAAVRNKLKWKSGRIPWNKAMGRKKPCPAVRKGELSRCAEAGLKLRKANGIIELESSRKNGFPRYKVALNLGSSSSAPNQHILSTQMRLTKHFPPDKSPQQLADKRSLEMQKREKISIVKRYLLDSSPQENTFSLCSTTGEKQMSYFSLRSPGSPKKPHPAAALPQQNTGCCSLFFDSDYSD